MIHSDEFDLQVHSMWIPSSPIGKLQTQNNAKE